MRLKSSMPYNMKKMRCSMFERINQDVFEQGLRCPPGEFHNYPGVLTGFRTTARIIEELEKLDLPCSMVLHPQRKNVWPS